MSYTLVIGNKNYSSWSLRPWYLMRYFNIEFNEIKLKLDTPSFYEEIVKYNPAQKVPTLVDDNFPVWDSLAIAEYIADKHPELNIWPADPKSRAQARVVSAEMHSGFPDVRNAMPMNCRATGRHVEHTDGVKKDINRIQTIWSEAREIHADAGEWLFGAFSAADAMYAPVASRFRTYGVTLDDTGEAYVDTVLNNAVYQEWLEEGRAEKEIVEADEAGA